MVLMDDRLRALGEAVRQRRQYLELSREELAEKAGCEVSWLHDLEIGALNPNVDVLVRIAEAMDTSTSDLLSGIPS
jgi:transcriptional regulator with XRE-family HTH domain